MRWARMAVPLTAASVLLGACGHGRPAQVASTAAPAVTAPSPTAHKGHRPYSDMNPPPRRAGDFVVKVLLVSTSQRPGSDLWSEEVRTCVKESSSHAETVGWDDWRAEGTDGRLYPADARGLEKLPTPTYPFHKVLAPGECVTGWWLIPVPAGPEVVDAIQFVPHPGAPLIEWKSLR